MVQLETFSCGINRAMARASQYLRMSDGGFAGDRMRLVIISSAPESVDQCDVRLLFAEPRKE